MSLKTLNSGKTLKTFISAIKWKDDGEIMPQSFNLH